MNRRERIDHWWKWFKLRTANRWRRLMDPGKW
jgi:hypothetical protein